MSQTTSQKRPWLAALLAAALTGFGHLYLRRWRRAFGWLAVSFGVSVLFIDPSAVDTLMAGSGGLGTLLEVAPMFLVIGGSIVDAYLLAYAQNTAGRSSAVTGATTSDEDAVACPHCGNALDPELEFCHWCTRAVDNVDRDRREITDDT